MKKDWPTHDMGENLKFTDLSVGQERKDNSKLYRFMSIDRFKELLNTKSLFFAEAKILSDNFEGGYIIPGLDEICLENRESTFVNCWTKNNPLNESSLLMWRPHSNGENIIECENQIAIGISINTFFLNEDSSHLFLDKKFEKYIGNLKYLVQNDDYPKTCQPNSLVPFFLKRDDYINEKEIRIVIQDMKRKDTSRSLKKYQILNGKTVPGIPVLIDLKKINEILISSIAECNINDIKGLIRDAELDIDVKRVPMPSKEAFNEAIAKVERFNELNKKQVEGSKNPKQPQIINRNYPVRLEGDASGNYYCGHACYDNSESGEKKNDAYIYSSQNSQNY